MFRRDAGHSHNTVGMHPGATGDRMAAAPYATKVLGADQKERAWLVILVEGWLNEDGRISLVQVTGRHEADVGRRAVGVGGRRDRDGEGTFAAGSHLPRRGGGRHLRMVT
jgi:hypothetical protein